MNDKRPSRRDELAFWLGMTALLLALCPLATLVVAQMTDRWGLPPWLGPSGVAAMMVAPALGIGVGTISLLVRLNWRGGAGMAIGALWLIAFFTLQALLGDAPGR